MAHLSEDNNLTHAFNNDIDVHSSTAAEVFGVSIENVTQDQRRSAKAINFGLMYGMSAFGLTRQLGIPRGEAQEYLDTYFARYTGVRDYMNNIKAQAKEDKFVETIMGRRLYLNEINAANGLEDKLLKELLLMHHFRVRQLILSKKLCSILMNLFKRNAKCKNDYAGS